MDEFNESGEIIQSEPLEINEDIKIIQTEEILSKDIATFCNSLNIKPNTIYFPGSDISKLDNIFPKETKIIYQDDNERAIKELQNEGYNAYLGNPEEVDPPDLEEVDLLVLKNYTANRPLNLVKPSGYVLTSDKDEASNILINNSGFNLVAVIEKQNEEDKNPSVENDSIKIESIKRGFTEYNEEEDSKKRQLLRQRLSNEESLDNSANHKMITDYIFIRK